MKYLFILFLAGCTATAQQNSEEIKKDKEFEELMKRSSATISESAEIQQTISKRETEIIVQAVAKIEALKNEVTNLKSELNDVKSQLDSVTLDTGRSFKLLPISKE